MSFRHWVVISAVLFVTGLTVGLLAIGWLDQYLASNISALQNMAAALGPFKLSTAVFIFVKNSVSLVLSFALAPLLLLFPITVLTVNGALLSYVALAAAQQRSLGFVLLAILPHGVIELPALVIGEAAALSFGVSAMAAVLFEARRRSFGQDAVQQLKVLTLACAMLVPAALVEAFITPLLVSR